jgi:hypothetical protein
MAFEPKASCYGIHSIETSGKNSRESLVVGRQLLIGSDISFEDDRASIRAGFAQRGNLFVFGR